MADSKQQRRQRIIEAADRLLCHYGPAKTTVAEIAREAGVGVGTVYLEFDSKDEIIAELSRSHFESVLDRMQEAAEQPDASFGERLRAVLNVRVETFLELADQGTHAQDLMYCSCAAIEVVYTSFSKRELHLIAELLEAGARAGEFHISNPEQAARALRKAYVSFSPPHLFQHADDELDLMLDALHELILRGLLRSS